MIINEIVNQMLQQHTGGKVFFEKVDEAIRNEDVVQLLYNKIIKSKNDYSIIITTGKFGIFFSNWINCFGNIFEIVYVVNGGIREGKPVDSLECFKDDIKGQKFIIVDDSFYSGRTVDAIKEHVTSLGATYKGTFVVYDGSKEKRDDVKSLYRYYENK